MFTRGTEVEIVKRNNDRDIYHGKYQVFIKKGKKVFQVCICLNYFYHYSVISQQKRVRFTKDVPNLKWNT